MTMEDRGPTNPDPGVMATRPATAPDATPRAVGLPRCAHSTAIHESAAAAVATWVTTKAEVASPPEARALPPLNPNQPNQSSAAPRMVMVRSCGAMRSVPYPFLLPTTSTAARAETPELIWTTSPPAKSRAPMFLIQP